MIEVAVGGAVWVLIIAAGLVLGRGNRIHKDRTEGGDYVPASWERYL